MKKITLSQPIKVLLPTGTVELPAGPQEVEDHLADHWYVQAHVGQPGSHGAPGSAQMNELAAAVLGGRSKAAADEAIEAARKAMDVREQDLAKEKEAFDAHVASTYEELKAKQDDLDRQQAELDARARAMDAREAEAKDLAELAEMEREEAEKKASDAGKPKSDTTKANTGKTRG